MPRLANSVPKYRKHKQSSQAIVTLNGRDHLLGPHGTRASKLEYDRLIGEWLASGRSSSFGAPASDLLIVELAADYLAHLKQYHGVDKASEWHRVKPPLGPLRELYGRTPVAEFGPLQLKSLRQRYIALGWSRGYINHNVQRIVRMFDWAVGEGRLAPHVKDALKAVKGLRKGKTDAREAEPVMPVDGAIVDATLPHMPEVVADMVRFQRLTGCRPAEVCALRPCDVDRSGDVWLYRPERHKTEHLGRCRVVLIGPNAQAVLLRYLARDTNTHCFRPCDSMRKYLAGKHATRKTPLSCGNVPGSNRRRSPRKAPGETYAVDAYRRAIARACVKAELSPWGPNRLRHAMATELRAKFGLESAQVVLGHAKANTTEIYAERDMAKGVHAISLIG